MKLQVTHETRYLYTPVVETAQHVAHLCPRDTPSQQLLQHSLRIQPQPSELHGSTDVFGNTRVFFALSATHEALVVVADSVVETRRPTPPASPMGWEQVRERFRYRAGVAFDAAAEFVFSSPYVPRHTDFSDYARPSFAPGVSLLAAATDLTQRIYRDFEYAVQATARNNRQREELIFARLDALAASNR